jgi:copper chaperone CopZ
MTQSQTFPISGMTCGSCAAKVAARLREHPDIATAEVTAEPPLARITTTTPFSGEALDEWLRPLGKYHVVSSAPDSGAQDAAPPKTAETYRPLVILLGYLILVVAAAAVAEGHFNLATSMRWFMGGFFIAFSFFKMLDLRGFADAYRSYDLVAKAVPAYGWVYPFVELALGLGYLANWQPVLVNSATAVLMAVSLAGVLRAVLSKQAIRCACLGTVFNLPMSTVTIVEDALMLGMAVLALILPH